MLHNGGMHRVHVKKVFFLVKDIFKLFIILISFFKKISRSLASFDSIYICGKAFVTAFLRYSQLFSMTAKRWRWERFM